MDDSKQFGFLRRPGSVNVSRNNHNCCFLQLFPQHRMGHVPKSQRTPESFERNGRNGRRNGPVHRTLHRRAEAVRADNGKGAIGQSFRSGRPAGHHFENAHPTASGTLFEIAVLFRRARPSRKVCSKAVQTEGPSFEFGVCC